MLTRPFRFRLPTCVAALLVLHACAEEPVLQPLPLNPGSAVTEFRVEPDSVLLGWLGAKVQLKAQLRNAKGNVVVPPRVAWSSTHPNVAAVDSMGTVEGVGLGTARVVATFLDLADTAVVTVRRIPVSMSLTPDTVLFTGLGQSVDLRLTVLDGASRPIPDARVTWSSTSYAVAGVDDRGRVTAEREGIATITARVDTLMRSTRVRVATRAASMNVSPAQIRLDGVSDTARVVAVVRNAAGVPMHPPRAVFASSDTSVVTVDLIGFVIARKAGTAILTISADTLRATVPVTVSQTVAQVQIVPDTATLAVGETKAFAAVARDRFGFAVAGATVGWSSSNPGVAGVSAAGLVSGVAPGSALIVAAAGTRADTARVTVR